MPDTNDPDVRASDADRSATLEQLNEALGHGRITLSEFDERSQVVMGARTLGELAKTTYDLPAPASAAVPAGVAERITLSSTFSSVKRKGQWLVPRELDLYARFGSVELDLTSADIRHDVVVVEVDVIAGSVEMRLPEGSAVDLSRLSVSFGSTEDHRRDGGSGRPRFEFRGRVVAGSVELRGPRKGWFR